MSKVLDDACENANELNEVKNSKNLWVHELKKKLRAKQKRQIKIKIEKSYYWKLWT